MRYEDEIVGKDAYETNPSQGARSEYGDEKRPLNSSFVLVRDVAIALIVLIVVLQFVKPTIVFEHSMENTLSPEDYVFLAKQAYTFGEIERGDIIVFESTLLNERGLPKSLIKRVAGLPGDVVEISKDAVYVNGERLDEPYTKDGITPGSMNPTTIPEKSYFVLGDNRKVSMDSRSAEIGFVKEDKIKGKVVYRLFPLSKAGIIR